MVVVDPTFPPPPAATAGAQTPAAAAAAALANGRVALACQPIVNSADPGRVAFCEGLLRLFGPDGQPLATGAVIAAVEAGPLGRALDRRALALALAELRRQPDLRLSVNLSAHGLTDRAWFALVEAALDGDATLAERLIIEITETAPPAHAAALRDFAQHWQRRGVALALDDFGRGHTGFAQLLDLRWDVLKIDGGLCQRAAAEPGARRVVAALAELGRHFEALVVGEAVETAAQAATLMELGVEALQGFHFGAPAVVPRTVERGSGSATA